MDNGSPKKKATNHKPAELAVGQKIRELRVSHQLSLQKLAAKTDLTPSSISQIERGMSNPSLAALRRLAQAMGVPVFYFFMDDDIDESTLIVRSKQRKILKIPKSNVNYELLSPTLSKKMEIVYLELSPGQVSSNEHFSHEGEEACVVLSGYVTFLLGEASYELAAGDCIQYDALIPHKFINHHQAHTACLLFVVTPPSF